MRRASAEGFPEGVRLDPPLAHGLGEPERSGALLLVILNEVELCLHAAPVTRSEWRLRGGYIVDHAPAA